MKRNVAVGLSLLLDVAVVVIIWAYHDNVLQWLFSKEQAHFKNAYHLNLTASSVKFASWNSIALSDVCIQPDTADTLALIQHVEFKPSLFELLTGDLNLKGLNIDSTTITIYNLPNRSNVLFLKTDRHHNANSVPNQSNYYERANDWKERVLKLFNTAFTISNLNINYYDTAFVEQITVPHMVYNMHTLSGQLINQQVNDTIDVRAEVIDPGKAYQVIFEHRGNTLCYLPFLDGVRGFKCRFKSVTASVKLDNEGGELHVSPSVSVHNFHIQHWRLAKDDVVFQQADFSGLFKIRADAFELDSSSSIILNHAVFKVFTSYQTGPDTIFALNISMPEIPSDTFFNGLPDGMFTTLKGISCSGTLAYHLQFAIHTQQPDSLIFESQLQRKNFRIIHMGQENYARINEAFVYDAFNGDQFVRHISIGPDNPNFTPYSRINRHLPAAIMQSEDPSFMVHRGFVPEAFRESIAQNFKEKRFARGGSTITMQLVKNVFLNRNKTISRKAEEALIVYLVENLGLVSKERMMEVYLNVIEWGPNIYGVGEASRFYFNKTPAGLSLQECIFLAAIIPNPKYFRYQFNKQGEIKPYMADFFKLIANRLVMRGYLDAADTIHFVPHIKLSGPAAVLVVPVDSAAPVIDEGLPENE